MSLVKITENIYISSQIFPHDFTQIQQLGIKTLICHRPDDEDTEQPTFKEIKQVLPHYGVDNFIYQPVVGGNITKADALYLEKELSQLSLPLLMYCRTGMRSLLLWSMIQVKHGQNIDQLIQNAASFAFDLSPTRGLLQKMLP